MEYLFTPMFLEAQLMAFFSGFPKTLTHTGRHHRLSSISLLAVYILWLFWLLAGVFYPACKPLRMTLIEKKEEIPKPKRLAEIATGYFTLLYFCVTELT